MKKSLWLLIPVLCVGCIVYLVPRFVAVPVQTESVQRDTAIDAVPAVVEVQHVSKISLSGEEGGRIVKSNLKLGEFVEAGDLLVQVDARDLELEAASLRSRIEHHEERASLRKQEAVDLARAQEELANYERLFADGNYAELEIIRRRREFEAFRENQKRARMDEAQRLEDLRFQLERVKLRIERCTISAPSAGMVNQIFAFPGELIHRGARIAEIDSQKLMVIARINEDDFSGIEVGLDANVRLLAYGDRLFPAKVSQVLTGPDPDQQQYTVFLKLEIPEGWLLPGLSGEASIIRSRREDALLIPRAALLADSVFVVAESRAERRTVETGLRGLNQVEITSGLDSGERVITSPVADLRDGQRIRF